MDDLDALRTAILLLVAKLTLMLLNCVLEFGNDSFRVDERVGNPQNPNYLPMEVCKIVEGQRYSKRLNERQIAALLKVTCQQSHDRELDIVQTVDHNAYNEDPYAEEFGIKISEKLALVEACVLPAPWLNYHDTGREKDCWPRAGQRNI